MIDNKKNINLQVEKILTVKKGEKILIQAIDDEGKKVDMKMLLVNQNNKLALHI